MTTSPSPALIGIDWGTSSLRAYLLGHRGDVLDRRATGHGIQHLPAGGFAAALRGVAGEWLDRWPAVRVLAAGMIGSRNGWREVPYVECPADLAAIARGIVVLDTGAKTIHLVPGLENRGLHPDVMRGEETQIVGVLALQPHLGDRSLLVLPGTHCKWVTVEQERVTRFTTYLTGELFAMLRDHSILGRPAKESGQPAGPDALDQDAFVRGVHAVRDGGAAGVAPRLFSTRSLFLAGVLTAPQTIDYLSGMLIGEEIRSVLADLAGESCPPLVLLGAPSLCERYRLALAESGIDTVNVMNETGPSGLWRIATAAGLVT